MSRRQTEESARPRVDSGSAIRASISDTFTTLSRIGREVVDARKRPGRRGTRVNKSMLIDVLIASEQPEEMTVGDLVRAVGAEDGSQ